MDNLVLDNNSLTSSSGALTLTSAAAATWSTGAGALTIDGAGGINIGTTADQAVDFDASTLDIDASDEVTIDAASSSGISLDASAASNFTTSAGALTLDGADGINVAGNGSEIDLTTTDNVEINATTLALKNGNTANGGSITFYEDADSDVDLSLIHI